MAVKPLGHLKAPPPSAAKPASSRRARDPHEHDETRNYLSFRVGEEHYAIELLRVRELVGGQEIAQGVSDARMCGVLSLRSKQVPAMDLRTRFGVSRKAGLASPVSIVVRTDDPVDSTVALLIDELLEVKAIAARSIKPEYPPGISASFVRGATSGLKRPIYLLALERVLDLHRR
jgi:purine-binding chemotaxis protein CheW